MTELQNEDPIPWERFDTTTLNWFAQRLPDTGNQTARAAISEQLFFGRTAGLGQEEIDQAVLLFGTEAEVRGLLGREICELRAASDTKTGRDARFSSCKNILNSLVDCMAFLAHHGGLEAGEADDLSNVDGSVR